MEYIAILKLIGPWLLAGGVAYGGVRQGLNGQRTQLQAVSKRLETHIAGYNTDARLIVKTLSSLETKVDLLIAHKIKG